MTAESNNSAVKREATFTLTIDAPRALVFQLWIDPKHLVHWWGPHGFTNPRCDWDARPGGQIHVDMRGPDGTVYPMHGVYKEIVEPERLVFLTSVPGEGGRPMFEVLNTVTLVEQAKKTLLTVDVKVVSMTDQAIPHISGMSVGWSQTLERLVTYAAGVCEGSIR